MKIPPEDRITAWFASQGQPDEMRFPIGIGDDMAWVNLADAGSVLITTDMLLDKVHFDLSVHAPEQIGRKAMAVNLSDCAAMATQPVCAVVSVALPKGFGDDNIKRLYEGMNLLAKDFACPIIGGDITSWQNPPAVSVSMLSRPAEGVVPVRRSEARPGDTVCVTGTLGGSLRGRHISFTPRVREAISIASMAKINSMIDISDGLSTDLARICRASGAGALLEAGQIPVSDDALDAATPLQSALNDGEDFELLFTLSPANCQKLMDNWRGGVKITRIGTITAPGSPIETMGGARGTDAEAGKIQMVTMDDKIVEIDPKGYDHL